VFELDIQVTTQQTDDNLLSLGSLKPLHETCHIWNHYALAIWVIDLCVQKVRTMHVFFIFTVLVQLNLAWKYIFH